MHLKKFLLLYFGLLVFGTFFLSLKDLVFIYSAQSQLAKVDHHVPGKTESFYKLGGAYEEKLLNPVIAYSVDNKTLHYVAQYGCKDGCHKVGSDITIFYHKERPHHVLVMSFGDFWKYKIYFFIFMGVLLLSSLPYLYYTSNKRPSFESSARAD